MKKLKLIAGIFALTLAIGCSKDDVPVTPVVPPVVGKAPTNLDFVATPGANLSLKVKPTATDATSFDVYFGVAGETAVNIAAGAEASYTYAAEGTYNVKVVAKNTGTTTTIEKITAVIISKLTAAPVPTVTAADVINIFSDSYTNPTVNFRTDWSADSNPLKSVYKAITIAGNNAIEYSALSYVGIELAKQIDATTMTHFHIDVYSADFTKFKVKLVDFGANAAYDGGDDKAHELIFDAPKKDEWVSLDIPLNKFMGLTTKAHIAQIVLSAEPTGTAKVIIDNVYFYKGIAPPVPTVAMPLDFETSEIEFNWVGFGSVNAAVIANPDKTGINTSNKVVSLEKANGAATWAGASLALTAPIDVTKGTKIKVAVWSPKVGAKILLKSEDTTSPKDGNGNPSVIVEVQALTTVANAWEVLTFDLTTFNAYNASNSYRNIVLFPDFDVAGTGSTYYFDNITQSN